MNSSYYSNSGICSISYSFDNHNRYKMIGIIDHNILNYYYSLIPKYYDVNKPKHKAHISFVRKESPINIEHWGKYEGQVCFFAYSSTIRYDDTYFWIDVYCEAAEKIRKELGLQQKRYMSFHITIANRKNK